ncbi:hypothetical protein D3C79_828270 [compost metagenome]
MPAIGGRHLITQASRNGDIITGPQGFLLASEAEGHVPFQDDQGAFAIGVGQCLRGTVKLHEACARQCGQMHVVDLLALQCLRGRAAQQFAAMDQQQALIGLSLGDACE